MLNWYLILCKNTLKAFSFKRIVDQWTVISGLFLSINQCSDHHYKYMDVEHWCLLLNESKALSNMIKNLTEIRIHLVFTIEREIALFLWCLPENEFKVWGAGPQQYLVSLYTTVHLYHNQPTGFHCVLLNAIGSTAFQLIVPTNRVVRPSIRFFVCLSVCPYSIAF